MDVFDDVLNNFIWDLLFEASQLESDLIGWTLYNRGHFAFEFLNLLLTKPLSDLFRLLVANEPFELIDLTLD